MSLKTQLAEMNRQSKSRLPDETVATMLAATKALSESGIVERAPKMGETLQNFTLPNQLGAQRSLAELRKNGPVVITFYRGGWCPYCNLELHAYQQILPEIKATGATLVAITPELPDESLTTAERHNLQFEVLSDINSEYANQLGLAFTFPAELRPIYTSFGINIEKHNGTGQFDLPLSATFVVDSAGTIIFAAVDADYTLRAEPADVVQVLESLPK
ncbi:MAG: peroxiredoxin-like family protein [Desulfuromonas sp.]|nr:peroxiredoxin-like family protein [Desulfuromonas sp.]